MWFTYRQNNSGGYLHHDENVGSFISVEADTPEEADDKASEITENYSDFCDCCGERWFIESATSDGYSQPAYYGKPLRDMALSIFCIDAVFYYKDGRKEHFTFREKEEK